MGDNNNELGCKYGTMPEVCRVDHDRLIRIDENTQAILNHLAQLNGRVRKLEVWRGYTTGAVAVLLIALGVLVRAMF